MKRGTAIIIGAGPAGLTAAVELQRSTGIKPIVIEANNQVGGLARTIRYKGYGLDIGPHRFFSKSDRVMNWWLALMPLEAGSDASGRLRYQGKERAIPPVAETAHAQDDNMVMLVCPRKTRIYFMRRFFDYPLALTFATLKKMGLFRSFRAGASYLKSAVVPRAEEKTLEDFFINRFGKVLYLTFFKSYTEKVWGVPCDQISAEWGAQRIKGLSLRAVVTHFLKKAFRFRRKTELAQKEIETSLVEKFLYPKLGSGQMWEHAAELICKAGGEIHLETRIAQVNIDGPKVVSVEGIDSAGERVTYSGDYFFSTMPVRDLVRSFSTEVPSQVSTVSDGLVYRDFILVGLLVSRLRVAEPDGSILKDNWIYIQESDVLLGRMQIYNNWGPGVMADQDKVWLGLEYFCNATDPIWQLSDTEMSNLAISEAAKIGILSAGDVEDFHIVRELKTYPAYFGSYDRFDVIRSYLDTLENLFLIGRNGMHKYNNQDHSMLTAMVAVENIANGVVSKDNIWAVNTEMEYHEEASDRA